MYARMDSVEIPQDHINVTAIQEMSLIPAILKLNSQENSNSEIFHHAFHLNKLKSSFKASSLTVKQVDAKISTNV